MDFIPMIPLNENDLDKWQNIKIENPLPLLVLRNSVLFPGIVSPITVNRTKSINALLEAQKQEPKFIATLVQKDSSIEDPTPEDIQPLGTLSQIVKLITMPDDSITAIVQGIRRLEMKELIVSPSHFSVSAQLIKEQPTPDTEEFKALIIGMKELMEQVIQNSPNIPDESSIILKNINHPRFLISFIATNLQLSNAEKIDILSIKNITEQSQKVLEILKREAHFGELKKELTYKTKHEIEKQQKEYFLQQQLKNIKEELGGASNEQEIENLLGRAKEKKWSKEVQSFFEKNLQKLERMHPSAPEYAVVLNHLQLMLDLPWEKISEENYTLQKVRRVLNEDHYGMEKIKERIIEYMAVIKLQSNLKSPILCFVGPPGIGKTSLAQSVARAIGRKYARISLGGIHDESEIRGHRKTYIGAMPGRIIQSIKKINSSNPVMVLDEIDKIGTHSFSGDPSAALLEVLDPEQNHAFYDNYLEIEYDLSRTFFIATANDVSSIQSPLRDRMEIVELSGYDVEEKVHIASKHLIPKQMKAHGIEKIMLNWDEKQIESIIKDYTRESGVRDLDRKIAAICRNKAMHFVEDDKKVSAALKKIDVTAILGKPKFIHDIYTDNLPSGVVIGLAWTSVGGSILHIESSMYPGKGALKITGNVGKVMQESAEAAMTVIRSNATRWKIDKPILNTFDFHIHVPEGSTPKDGPSAGITIFSSLFSLITQKKPKPFIAMSGEITLRGEILPVGGIKEKILAAKRSGIKYIFLTEENERDVSEIKSAYIKGIKIQYVKNVNDLIKKVF